MFKRGLAKLSNSPKTSTMEELIYKADESFSANEFCNGCGICSEVCPVNNIKIVDKKPVWLNQCENCLACYNWCPNKAIESGLVTKGYYYRNPKVDIKEITRQST